MLGTGTPRSTSNNWWKIALAGIFLMIFACVGISAIYFAFFNGDESDTRAQAIVETVNDAAKDVNSSVSDPAYAAPQQQSGEYDLEWLRSIASQSNRVDLFNAAYNSTSNWKNSGGQGTFDVPAHTAVLGLPDMQTGNSPSFERLAENLYYTSAGGRFGAAKSFKAFQLDGAPVASVENRPNSIDAMIELINLETDYGRKIAALDQEWSSSEYPINRWGTSGPLELLSVAQQQALDNAGIPMIVVVQQLPGNTLVWGELADVGQHYGLVRISENVYATTCQGGLFTTYRGFRAMQFAAASENAVISDTTGCNGQYPVLDPNNPISVQPLANPSIGAQ